MDVIVHFLISVTNNLKSLIPEGGTLPDDVWQKRYSFLLGLTWFHATVIALIGPVLGYSWEMNFGAIFDDRNVLHTIFEGLIVGLFAALGSIKRFGRTLHATAIALGLMTASAMLVHFSGGYIESHFHFFVMLAFLALLQDWVPYILAIAYVAIHHGLVLPHGAMPGLKGGFLGTVLHTYPSEMAQNFWTAIFAWSACFVATIVISLLTGRNKTDDDLKGLVYALTPRLTDRELPWYQRPATLGVVVLGFTLVLNVIFW